MVDVGGLRHDLRRWAQRIKRTPLHPQWFSLRDEIACLRRWARHAHGTVLEIGCGHQRIRPFLGPGCRYIGVDYTVTARKLYGTVPQIFADGRALPVRNDCADTVLLLEVLEHIPQPERALVEAHRILRPGGTLIVSVPFLYPVHDAPYDFQRWTPQGIQEAVRRLGLEVVEFIAVGSPAETAALLANIGLAHWALRLLARNRVAGAFAAALTLIAVPSINVLAWLAHWLDRDAQFMPFACRLVCRKPLPASAA